MIHQVLKRKHVTLTIVRDEYIARQPDRYWYSRFCELYRGWEARVSVTMRQSHRAGEKLFVDHAGNTVPVIVDRLTDQTRGAQIFVAVLGAPDHGRDLVAAMAADVFEAKDFSNLTHWQSLAWHGAPRN